MTTMSVTKVGKMPKGLPRYVPLAQSKLMSAQGGVETVWQPYLRDCLSGESMDLRGYYRTEREAVEAASAAIRAGVVVK